MFHFHLAEIMQLRLPVSALFEIFSDALGKQDVSGVAAIHHSLRDVHPNAGRIRLLVHVDYRAHRSAVHAHAQAHFGMCLQCAMNLERAFHRLLRTFIENQRHSIAGRNFYQAPCRFRFLKFIRTADDLIEFINQCTLLVSPQFGIANNVDEQNMDDLQFDSFSYLR